MAFIQAETCSTIGNKILPEPQLWQTTPSVCPNFTHHNWMSDSRKVPKICGLHLKPLSRHLKKEQWHVQYIQKMHKHILQIERTIRTSPKNREPSHHEYSANVSLQEQVQFHTCSRRIY